MYVDISEILKGKVDGKKVSIRGWVFRQRSSGNLNFLVVRDATGRVQVAVKKDKIEDGGWKDASEAYIESSVEVAGEVKKDERAPGGWELQVSEFRTVHQGEPFPISKDLSEEFLLDVRHLWLRSRKLASIFKARHHLVNYLREYLDKEGFYETPPPVITKAECEGGSTLFEMDYFGDKAYLSQSGQLYQEALIFGLGKVYAFAPSFRAEKSRTIRHLAEYWHLEPEMAWYSQEENMKLQEDMVEFAIQKFAKEHVEVLEELERDPKILQKVKAPFIRMDYEDAVDKVNELGGKMEQGDDFGTQDEALLTKELEKPLFIHNFPSDIKAFYMRDDPEKPGTVLAADMLAPEGHGEMIGGSERVWELPELEKKMKAFGLSPKQMAWYVDLRKYGSVPHSGFGMGIERFVKWTLGLHHIRDTIPFPRTITRAYP
ncbi:asparagine--tRNA ligase [Candidatus Micrarchaeota archaeon]|nr:asparagine--tRNA ligase [Candidatus Micrarchaeota archaeon]MBD3417429.1 asparagine--tRNA ligase [Candidatus Micrarchaeota archaeon]